MLLLRIMRTSAVCTRTRWTIIPCDDDPAGDSLRLRGRGSSSSGDGSSLPTGGGGTTPPTGGGGTALPAKILSWAAPESYTDNTSLNPITDLDGYEIYVNQSGSFADADTPSAVVSAVDTTTHTLTTSFNLANLGSLSVQGSRLPGIDAGRRHHGSKVRFFSPRFLLLLIAPSASLT